MNPIRMTTALASAILRGACNTIQGAGQDIKYVGKTLEETAEAIKDDD